MQAQCLVENIFRGFKALVESQDDLLGADAQHFRASLFSRLRLTRELGQKPNAINAVSCAGG